LATDVRDLIGMRSGEIDRRGGYSRNRPIAVIWFYKLAADRGAT
jgi:hypothetical protein